MTDEQLQDFRFRDTTRAPYRSRVNVRYDRFGGDVVAQTADISMEGMFLQSDDPRPVGTLVQFELALDDGQEVIQGLGDVVWVRVEAQGPQKPTGMGIQFRYIDTASRERIRRIVAAYIDSEGAPAATSAVGEAASEEPSAEPASLAEQLGGGATESFVSDDDAASAATVQLAPGTVDALLGGQSSADEAPAPPDFLQELSTGTAAQEADSAEEWQAPPSPGDTEASEEPPQTESVQDVQDDPDVSQEVVSPEASEVADPEPLEVEDPEGFGATEILPVADLQPSEEPAESPESNDDENDDEESAAAPTDEPEVVEPEAESEETDDTDAAPAEEAPAEAPLPMSEWDELLEDKPNRTGLWMVLAAVVLLGAFGFVFRERISLLMGVGSPASPAVSAPASEPTASEPVAAEPPTEDAGDAQPAAGEPEATVVADGGDAPSTPAETEPAPEPTAPAPSTRSAPAGDGRFQLLGISAESDEAGTTVLIRTDRPVDGGAVRYSRLESPPRYVVKLRGTDSRPSSDVSTSEVQQIRMGLHDVDGLPEVHLVFDLAAEGLEVEPSAEGQLVRIRLSRP